MPVWKVIADIIWNYEFLTSVWILIYFIGIMSINDLLNKNYM